MGGLSISPRVLVPPVWGLGWVVVGSTLRVSCRQQLGFPGGARQPCLGQLVFADRGTSQQPAADRPGNWSLERVAESRKALPGLAAEVSGLLSQQHLL